MKIEIKKGESITFGPEAVRYQAWGGLLGKDTDTIIAYSDIVGFSSGGGTKISTPRSMGSTSLFVRIRGPHASIHISMSYMIFGAKERDAFSRINAAAKEKIFFGLAKRVFDKVHRDGQSLDNPPVSPKGFHRAGGFFSSAKIVPWRALTIRNAGGALVLESGGEELGTVQWASENGLIMEGVLNDLKRAYSR